MCASWGLIDRTILSFFLAFSFHTSVVLFFLWSWSLLFDVLKDNAIRWKKRMTHDARVGFLETWAKKWADRCEPAGSFLRTHRSCRSLAHTQGNESTCSIMIASCFLLVPAGTLNKRKRMIDHLIDCTGFMAGGTILLAGSAEPIMANNDFVP